MREAIVVLEAARDTLPLEEQGEARAELLSTLSRAYMRSDRMDEALDAADAALAISERLELDGITAEALQNKSGVLGSRGRRHEAIALMQAAVDLARSGGYLLAELRATANIASVVSAEDLPRSHAASLASLTLARRTGHRPFASWALSFHAYYTFLEGRGWDELIGELEEELERATGPVEEARLLSSLITFWIARGEPVRDRIERRADLIRPMTDPFAHALQAWLEGDDRPAPGGLSRRRRRV